MIVKQEINVAKELQDVMKLVRSLIKTIKEKGDYLALMPDLINAIQGIDQIDDEFKADIEAAINTALIESNGIVWDLVKNPFEKKEVVEA